MAALALVPSTTAAFGAALGFVLLLVFIIGIARNLARGRSPDCHCFGRLHSEPAGPKVLVRNAALAAGALLVIVANWREPGPSLVASIVPLTAFERFVALGGALGLVLLSAQIVLRLRLTRRNDQLLDSSATPDSRDAAPPSPARIADPRLAASPAVGSPAPTFSLAAVDGPDVTLGALVAAGKPVVLIFADPGCGPCSALMPRIAAWQREHHGSLTFAVVSRGTPAANRAKADEIGSANVLLQRDREVAPAYGVLGTPAAALVRADGTIGSPPAQGEADITKLIEQAAREAARAMTQPGAEAPQEGQDSTAVDGYAPDFTLPDLHGNAIRLSEFVTVPTVLLFWNPRCGFCRRILEAIRAWDARPLEARRQLLVLSSAELDDNRELGLTSTIVLDDGFAVGRQFGARGTPAAVLLHEDGRLASELATGAPAVLELLGMTMGDALPAGSLLLKHEGVEDELLPDGGMVLYNTTTQQVLTLNGTAALIWENCDGERSLQAIVEEIRELFPSTSDADRDVRQLVDRLLHNGMLSLVDASAGSPSGASAGPPTLPSNA